MDSNIQRFQADSEGVVWVENLWPTGDDGESDYREFIRRDGLNVLIHKPSGACDLGLKGQRLQNSSPDFWFKEMPEGIIVMTRDEVIAAQRSPTYRREDLAPPRGNFRARVIDIIDEKYPLGTVEAKGRFYGNVEGAGQEYHR